MNIMFFFWKALISLLHFCFVKQNVKIANFSGNFSSKREFNQRMSKIFEGKFLDRRSTRVFSSVDNVVDVVDDENETASINLGWKFGRDKTIRSL